MQINASILHQLLKSLILWISFCFHLVFSLSLEDYFVWQWFCVVVFVWVEKRFLAWPTAVYQIISKVSREKNPLFHGWPFHLHCTQNRFTLSHRKLKSENVQRANSKKSKTFAYGTMKNDDVPCDFCSILRFCRPAKKVLWRLRAVRLNFRMRNLPILTLFKSTVSHPSKCYR